MPARPADPPTLWIIAGANGSGKTSAFSGTQIDAPRGSVWIINPDELALRIAYTEGVPLAPDANLEAVRRIETWLYASVDAHQTVGVETVLSTDKYRKLVAHAKTLGFSIALIYVFLATAELNLERVRIRVAKGGHDVPAEKIVQRRERSLDQLPWFFREADRALIFDNSGAEPKLVAKRQLGVTTIYGDIIDDVANPLDAVEPGLFAHIVKRRG